MTPNTHSASIEYATKADLDQLAKDLRAEMRELRLEIKADIAALQIALLRQQAWLLVAMTAIFSAVVAVAKLFP